MNLEHFIHIENNAISDELCEEIIEEYNDSDDWKPEVVLEDWIESAVNQVYINWSR